MGSSSRITQFAHLVIPFPPTLNHDVGRNGWQYYKTDDYKRFQQHVCWTWMRDAPRLWDPGQRFAVAIALYYDSRRKYDVDNRVKPTLDALTAAGAWNDDSQVDLILVAREEIDKNRPRAEVWIKTFGKRGFLERLFDAFLGRQR